tara:strand:- start:596 stop:790 length:195 start_codon:yes stop_codon:yes gene_type:complete
MEEMKAVILSIPEFALELRGTDKEATRRMIRKWCAEKKLKFIKEGTQFFIPRSELTRIREGKFK